jgi:type II secretory pathway pseudopilin PulG
MNFATAEACKRCRVPFYSGEQGGFEAPGAPAANFASGGAAGGNEGGWAQTGTGQAGWGQTSGADAGWSQANAGPASWSPAGGGQSGWSQPGYGRQNSGGSFPYQLDAQPKSGGAIATLVMGVVSVPLMFLCGLGLFTAIAGMITGIVALRRINREPRLYAGKGMAIGGMVVCGVAMAMSLIVLAVAVPNFMAARRAANEGAAQNSLRKIHAAEMTYQRTTGQGQYGTLPELQRAGLIDTELGSGTRSGYRFSVTVSGNDFDAHAVPESYGSSGNRSFLVSSDGAIHAANKHGLDADSSDPTNNQDADSTRPGSSTVPAGYHPASEASAIRSMRTLHGAEVTYQATAGAGKFGTLRQLAEANLIDDTLGTGTKDGYVFKIRANGDTFECTGTPKAEYVLVGDNLRSFYTNQSGQILGANKQGAEGTASDPPAY